MFAITKKNKKMFTNIPKHGLIILSNKQLGGIIVNEINNTLEELKTQAHHCINDIVGRSGQELQESARIYGALVRLREVKDAKLLLQLLLIYAISDMSQKMMSLCGYLIGAGNISDQAWDKKIKNSGAWICFLLNESLIKATPTHLAFYHYGNQMQVYLLDASTLKQVGAKGQELRVHMCYNLTKGAMEEVIVTDNHTAESAKTFKIQPGHLYIADAGYGKGKNLAQVISQKGNALFRFTPNLVSLSSDAEGKLKINMAEKLKTKKQLVKFTCYIHTEKGRYIPVQIIASRLPDDKALLARERKMRNSSKKQTKLKDETLVYAGWVLLMTNLDSSHSAESLLHLYRSRWQIELLFKRIKQFFKVRRLRKATLGHSKVLVLLLLLIWAFIERKTISAEIYLLNKEEELIRYSLWSMTELFFARFKVQIQAFWVFCFDEAQHLDDAFRFLRNHRRKPRRINQYAVYRFGIDSRTNSECSYSASCYPLAA